MTLRTYRAKRDFKKTDEPKGGARQRSSTAPIFVVHKHRARALHYDFRLAMGGVLVSWAVPKGPSMKPSDKRLAVHVEDHPLEYASFHGTIPEGQYGAGKVEIWDKGTYEKVSGSVRGGELVVDLKGKKLKGIFVLVRMKKPKQWLLIKKREAL